MRGGGNMGMGRMGGMDCDMMGGMRGGGMNMPYGYNNMTSFNNRPRFNHVGGRGGGAGPMNRPQTKIITLSEVQNWLDKQQPFVLQTLMKNCRELLVNKHKVPLSDLSDWYKEQEPSDEGKTGTILQGGVDPGSSSKNMKRDLKPGLGWTKSDMRHPHKVTTQMKPLPELEIIPPFSAENKEADIDREKRKMLTNNVSMMQMEVTKICNRFKIPLASLDKDNLEQYPEAAREKLSLALNCVKNAEQTLTDFLDFLKTEKYKEWNDEQKAKRESLLKSMIGETPQGKPHVAAVKEDDIELVNDARIKFDDAGNFAVKQKRVLEEKSLDELEAEKNGSAAKNPKNDDE